MIDVKDGIAVITLDNAPVNALSHKLRAHIGQQLAEAYADAAVLGVLLIGTDRAFSAGADVSELGTREQLAEPILPALIACIEEAPKPVVAALSGVALGGGLELAMACHARIALATARVGLPEIKLGLIPGSGGTQRLPRLAGVETALAMILDGETRRADSLAQTGLFDRVVESDLRSAGVSLARQLAQLPSATPAMRERPIPDDSINAQINARREGLNRRQQLQPAYAAALDAIAACSQPLGQGLKLERKIFMRLLQSPQAAALRYQFKAEREAGKMPLARAAEALPVKELAVIGGGTMGAGIAIAILEAQLPVLLLEQDEAALQRGLERVKEHYRNRVVAGKLTETASQTRLARLTGTTNWIDIHRADLIIEAVFEDLSVKCDVFRKIDLHARTDAVLASNTSYLDIDAIADATRRPGRVLGLHFFSPAQVMRLVEVVQGSKTEDAVLATGMKFAAALGKQAVPCGNGFGFIGNRIYNAYRRECEFMLEDGALPEQIDAALEGMGFAMGPFSVADLSGLDIAWRMRKAQASIRNPHARYVDIADQLCELGRFGRKSLSGYYNYAEGEPARTTDSTVRGIIESASRRRGIERRPLGADEICRRALQAMADEAAQIVSDGIAHRPSDVDVVLVQGYGFPRWEGGPIFWAQTHGVPIPGRDGAS